MVGNRKMSNMRENKMGTMPVGKLIINMSLPMMISMMVQAFYNVVDSIFVAKINEAALTAVSLAFPLQALLIAVGTGTGVGINAVLSRALGEKNFTKVNKAATTAVSLIVFEYIIFILVGIYGVKPFFMSQTSDATIVQYGIDYTQIIMCISIGVLTAITMERLVQSTGKTIYAMITQGAGAITNIILDPILIFGLFGAPKMGVAGAALATVIGQILGGCMGIYCNIRYNHEIQINWKRLIPDIEIVKEIYTVGIPSIIMQAIGSIMVYCLNLILVTFSTTATAVFGVYFKMQSFIFMPVFGLNNGVVPIIAYSYGANNRIRMIKTIKGAIAIAMSIMAVGTVIFMVFAPQLLMMFDASDNMMAMGVTALRIISVHFVIAGFCIVAGSVFQALGNGVYSLIVSILRQIVVLIPAAYLLSLLGKVDYVWWSFPIAEFMSLLVSSILLLKIYKNVISKLDDGRH